MPFKRNLSATDLSDDYFVKVNTMLSRHLLSCVEYYAQKWCTWYYHWKEQELMAFFMFTIVSRYGNSIVSNQKLFYGKIFHTFHQRR